MPYRTENFMRLTRAEGETAPRILEIAEALHGSNTGACDPLPDDLARDYVVALREVLATWRPSLRFTSTFDDAVRSVIVAVCEETEAAVAKATSDLFNRVRSNPMKVSPATVGVPRH